MRQTGFGFLRDYKKEFGGSGLQGKRKTARPLSTKRPIHLVLKSTGRSCFVPGSRKIESLIRKQCETYGIKLYEISLNWSHVHLLVRLPSREAYVAFIRAVTSLLVEYHELNDMEARGLLSVHALLGTQRRPSIHETAASRPSWPRGDENRMRS